MDAIEPGLTIITPGVSDLEVCYDFTGIIPGRNVLHSRYCTG